MKTEYFHPNMMMMHSVFLQQDLKNVASADQESFEYMENMINKCGPIKSQQKQMVCLMNLDCKPELV